MTLWAVQVTSQAVGSVTTRFPVAGRGEAVESAARINDWVAYMIRSHPATPFVEGVVADVVEWADSPELHAQELAQTQAFIAEEEETS